jgi:hypothetical protein
MPIDFPSSPTVGQQYIYAGITYIYSAQGVWSQSIPLSGESRQPRAFRATKGGTAQTGIPNGLTNFTKVTFTSEDYDLGDFYDAANSRWTPPSGLVHIHASLLTTNVASNVQFSVIIYKNGAELKRGSMNTAGAFSNTQVGLDDFATGTDSYEVYTCSNHNAAYSVVGDPLITFFEGHITGGPKGDTGQAGVPGSVTGYSGAINCGRLTYASSTALLFAPFNGNQIRISGTSYSIPVGGIAGLSSPTNAFINGVAAQTLAINTVYWIFAFLNSGVVTADFRTAATHAPSTTAGNEGVEILTGNDSRSLIGMCRTNAAGQFADSKTQRFVRSWMNRQAPTFDNSMTAQRSTTSTSSVEINQEIRCEILTWVNEAVIASIVGYLINSGTGMVFCAVGWDGVANAHHWGINTGTAAIGGSAGVSETQALTEGYHYLTVMGSTNSGTGFFGQSATFMSLTGRIG